MREGEGGGGRKRNIYEKKKSYWERGEGDRSETRERERKRKCIRIRPSKLQDKASLINQIEREERK